MRKQIVQYQCLHHGHEKGGKWSFKTVAKVWIKQGCYNNRYQKVYILLHHLIRQDTKLLHWNWKRLAWSCQLPSQVVLKSKMHSCLTAFNSKKFTICLQSNLKITFTIHKPYFEQEPLTSSQWKQHFVIWNMKSFTWLWLETL